MFVNQAIRDRQRFRGPLPFGGNGSRFVTGIRCRSQCCGDLRTS